tara:strand:- start:350 stop:1999 length:1650 start_codon:yes stop_codon:yes gene_type:complete
MNDIQNTYEGSQLKGMYERGFSHRESYLNRARECAKLTIPTLLKDQGSNWATTFQTPFQSIGARGVNHLASKLLLTLLPPNSPFFRLTIDDFDIEALVGPEQRGAVEEGFAKIERSAMNEIETEAYRVPVFEALKHLITTGNCLLYLPEGGGMRVFHLDRYICKRDPMGNLLYIITKESLDAKTVPENARVALGLPSPQELSPETPDKPYELFTYVCNKGKYWHIHQEIGTTTIPESFGKFPIDKSPFIALRFSRVDGESYGRGLVEEYLGDLKSLEALSQAIVEGSAAASKVLFLVRPNGTTRIKTIADAPSGAIVQGDSNDVSTLQVDKFNDFRIAQDMIRDIQERLAAAFLLNSSVQRNAERVTAEEIRFMAQELESALGGVYSVLSQEFQLPLINILLGKMVKQKKMPKFPKEAVKPQIVTGMEALGRGQDLNKLSQFLEYLAPLGPEVLSQKLNIDDYMDRLGASLGIDTGGLIKTDEQIQQEQAEAQQAQQAQMEQAQQAQMQADVIKGATPNMVKGMNEQMANNPEMAQAMQEAMSQQMGNA